jgi:hypothetical protein
MGDIIIETPQGNVQIEIEGDAPNEKEKKAIMDKFFSQPSIQPKAQNLDLSDASVEEIQDYARQKRLEGIDPLTNQAITEDEFISKYKEPGVDYSTGLDSIGSFSRFGYGRMDTDEERAGYLREKVGEDGFRQDALGRFILTKKGRQTLGMGKGKEIAIDEEGLSFNDLKDFAGATAAPIGAAIGASLMASGIGFIPGVALVGAAGFAGKALDEAVEYSQGLQKQSFGDVLRDSAFEGAFALAGEGVGRGISSFFGRLIKGPGGPENEALRAQARKLVNQGFRPTVAGATDESFRPILNRLQSIYEGVFPQKVAAQQNLKLALQELENVRGVNKQSIKDLNDSIMKDIDQAYANTNQKFEMAQKNISKDTEAIVSKIMSQLKDDQNVSKKLADKLTLSKSVFDRDMDALYSGINRTLKGRRIVNTGPIIKALDELAETAPLDIKATKFYKDIKNLEGGKATVLEMNRIRTQLSQASYSPEVFGGATSNALGRMKKVVEQSLRDAEVDLTRVAAEADAKAGFGQAIFPEKVPDLDSGTVSTSRAAERVGRTTRIFDESESFPIGDVGLSEEGLDLVNVQTALRNLRRANRLYGVGMGRFDKVVNENLLKEARRGTLNPNYIFNEIITKDNPDALRQVLAAVRGLPTTMKKIDLQKGKAFIESQRIGTKTIDEALDEVKFLNPNDPARLAVERDVLKIQRNAEELAQIRGTGAEVAEELRQNLGRMFLKEQLDKSKVIDKITGQEVFDGVKLANNLSSLGSTAKILFKKELNEIDDVVQTLRRSNANLSDDTATALEGKPLFDSLKELKQATKAKADLEKDDLINSLQRSGGDPEKIAQVVFKTPESINVAKTNLTPQTFGAVQDAAMGKLLKDIGAAVDDVGRPRLTPDFEDAFKSGALGTKLKNVLTNYGDDTINAMFGKGTAKTLNTLADDMVKVSNAATVGKGGLAAPTIALSLTLFGLVTAPLATIPTALGFAFMSKMLRNPTVLKIMMASRKPGADKLGQLFQIAQTTAAQLEAQGARGLTEQTAEEVKPITGEVAKQLAPQISQMKTDLTSQITPPSAASSAGGVSPLGTNPIVNPNPTTQALAQSLQGRN